MGDSRLTDGVADELVEERADEPAKEPAKEPAGEPRDKEGDELREPEVEGLVEFGVVSVENSLTSSKKIERSNDGMASKGLNWGTLAPRGGIPSLSPGRIVVLRRLMRGTAGAAARTGVGIAGAEAGTGGIAGADVVDTNGAEDIAAASGAAGAGNPVDGVDSRAGIGAAVAVGILETSGTPPRR